MEQDVEYIKTKNITLADQIIVQIKEMIERGAFKIGDKLPSERELSKRFGVSRLPLREALSTLDFIGVLEARQGNGYVIKGLGKSRMLDLLAEENFQKDLFNDLKEVRMALEVKAVELACKRRTDRDLKKMKEAMARMTKAGENGEVGANVISASLDFHQSILSASCNRILSVLFLYIHDFGFLKEGRKKSFGIPGRYELALKEHQQIYNAVEKKDEKKAIELMRHHLETSY